MNNNEKQSPADIIINTTQDPSQTVSTPVSKHGKDNNSQGLARTPSSTQVVQPVPDHNEQCKVAMANWFNSYVRSNGRSPTECEFRRRRNKWNRKQAKKGKGQVTKRQFRLTTEYQRYRANGGKDAYCEWYKRWYKRVPIIFKGYNTVSH